MVEEGTVKRERRRVTLRGGGTSSLVEPLRCSVHTDTPPVYGKWPFYRLGPIQEPISALASLGNLFVNLKGLEQVRRRVRQENGLRRWLEVLAFVQVNTWVWSAVFHCRGGLRLVVAIAAALTFDGFLIFTRRYAVY